MRLKERQARINVRHSNYPVDSLDLIGLLWALRRVVYTKKPENQDFKGIVGLG